MTGDGVGPTEDGSQTVRDHLLEERRTVRDRLARLRTDHLGIVAASAGSNADDEHDPEGATIAFERQQVDALARQAERALAEIDAALSRLADATYGSCEVCGGAIPAERLRIRPSARTCVPCAAAP